MSFNAQALARLQVVRSWIEQIDRLPSGTVHELLERPRLEAERRRLQGYLEGQGVEIPETAPYVPRHVPFR